MDLTNIGYYDLYFFSDMAHAAIEPKSAVVASVLDRSRGGDWLQHGGETIAVYRAQVELVIKEEGETNAAQRALAEISAGVQSWRRTMEALARQDTAKKQRKALLHAAGYGLGSPRSAKELDDFLLAVTDPCLVELHAGSFVELGAEDDDITYAAEAMAKFEASRKDVAREKAEDTKARTDLAAGRDDVLAYLRDIDLALQAVRNRAERRADDAAAKAAIDLAVALEKALGESRVVARKARASDPVPALLVEPAPEPSEPTEPEWHRGAHEAP